MKTANTVNRTHKTTAAKETDTAIEMSSISKIFGSKTVLKEVSLSINRGEIFGLLGPSGAGKTTLLKILTGQIPPASGSSSLFGTDSQKRSDEICSSIGMVLDNSGLYCRLNCYDNLMLFARIFNVKKERICEVLQQVKLSEDAKTPVNQLSKGMTQRLVLARAILHKPRLLFLDEPTSGLDPHTAEEIHSLIFLLRDEGATVFLTTHNMEEATKLCDNVALLNEGIIVEYGRPEEICRKHNSQNIVTILCKDGTVVSFSNHSTSADTISTYFKEDRVAAIHSSEPNLETVFIAVTGRTLT